MRVVFEQLVAEYPIFSERYCSDQRDDRQNLMMMASAAWAIEAGAQVELHWDREQGAHTAGADAVFLVLFSVAAYQLKCVIDDYRSRSDCRVFVCGPHARSFPDHCYRAGADVVVGLCDQQLFLEMLDDVKRGEVRQHYETARPIARFPSHARLRELELVPEQGFMNVLASTGCPYRCEFCSDAATPYSPLAPADVVQSIATSGEPLVIFNDPTLGIGKGGTEVLEGLAALGDRHFMAFTTSVMLRRPRFRSLLSEAGCLLVEVGIENVNSPFNKNRNTDFASLLVECDFLVLANYIYGYDVRDFSEATEGFLADLVRRCPNVLPMVFVPFSLPEAPLHRSHLDGQRVFDESYLCIGNDILSLRTPGVVSPKAYYARLGDVRARLHDGLTDRARAWVNDHPRLPASRKQVMSTVLDRYDRDGCRFDEWSSRVVKAAPERFAPFAGEVLASAIPHFARYDLAL
jgi:hypothetical protein